MALIPITQAAAWAAVTVQEIESWSAQGLLTIHSPGRQPCVDEEQFQDLVDSLGWLQLSSENWDDAEDE